MEIVGRISNLVSDSSIRKENRRVCLCFCSVVSVSLRFVFLLPSSILRRFVPLFYFLSFDQREREREEKNISEIGYKEQTEKGIDIIDVDFSRTRPTGERNCIRKRKRQRSRGALFSLKSKALFHPSCFFRVLRLAFHYHSPPFSFFFVLSQEGETPCWFLKSYRSGILVPWLSIPPPRENLLPRFTASDLSRPCSTSSGGTRGRHPSLHPRIYSNPMFHTLKFFNKQIFITPSLVCHGK